MSGVLVFAAKRAVIDALTTALASSQPDVQVAYTEPGDAYRSAVFAGEAALTRDQPVAEWAVLTTETCVLTLWVRAQLPGDDTRAAETTVEQIANAVVDVVAARPAIGDGMMWGEVASGLAHEPAVAPGPEPSVTAVLQLQVAIVGSLT